MKKLFYDSAYIRTFEAKVLSCEKGKKGYEVALDQTAFYPEGGGQPYDTGILGGAHVTAVHDVKGEIVHYTDAPLAVGETVTGEINWDRRFQNMQGHSGEHLVSGLIHAKYGYDNVGFHMGTEEITIDLNGLLEWEDLMEIEKKANRIIWEDREIYAGFPSAEELAHMDYRSKKELTGAMLGVGSASVLSRAIGKKDENTIKKIMGNLVAMVLLLSVIYTVVGMVFTRQLLSLTGASDNILNYAEKYLRIVFAGSLFVNFFQSANMVIRGEGQLKRAMTIIASGAILNIILDPIFISILNPYGMGIEAAAYATIFSQFVQAAITLWYFKKKSPHVKIGRIRIDGELLPQVLSVGISALLMQILTLVQQTVIYRVASNYGGETSQLLLAAALRFWNFSFVPLWGISQGFQPAAGTNYGAKDYDRVKTLTRVFIIAATLLSLVFYIPAELFPEKILSMFLTTPGFTASHIGCV